MISNTGAALTLLSFMCIILFNPLNYFIGINILRLICGWLKEAMNSLPSVGGEGEVPS